ncbi:MAG: hypothetical protein U0T81_09940 [Saprospiraceae bacterium]
MREKVAQNAECYHINRPKFQSRLKSLIFQMNEKLSSMRNENLRNENGADLTCKLLGRMKSPKVTYLSVLFGNKNLLGYTVIFLLSIFPNIIFCLGENESYVNEYKFSGPCFRSEVINNATRMEVFKNFSSCATDGIEY